jgi:hypothetical protein
MHIEKLGKKTYLLSFNAKKAELQEDGSYRLAFLNGSTQTRLSIPSQLMDNMPDKPCMAVVSGEARLKLWVNPDCNISGVEEMDVEEMKVSSVQMQEEGFSATVPF